MKSSEKLFNDVFEEIDFTHQMNELSGTGFGIDLCTWMTYCCLHGIIIGSSGNWSGKFPDDMGGGYTTDACDIMEQVCK